MGKVLQTISDIKNFGGGQDFEKRMYKMFDLIYRESSILTRLFYDPEKLNFERGVYYQFDIITEHLGEVYMHREVICLGEYDDTFVELRKVFSNALFTIVYSYNKSFFGLPSFEINKLLAGEEISYSITVNKLSKSAGKYDNKSREFVCSSNITKRFGE